MTIKDIAEKLNMHHTTVSRALRNHPDVNEKTRQAILEAAEKYNYIPNSFAKSLRNAQSRTIVVMVPDVRNFFFSEIEYGAFQRTFRLPADAASDKIDADFRDDVLRLRIAKEDQTKPAGRKIEVRKS